MRCVKEEHTAVNMTLHYLDNGTVMLNFIYQKELFFLPIGFVLKVTTKSIPPWTYILLLHSNRWVEGPCFDRTEHFDCSSSKTFAEEVSEHIEFLSDTSFKLARSTAA